MRRMTAVFSSLVLLTAFASTACDRGGGGGSKEKAESKSAEKKGAMKKEEKKAEKEGKEKKEEETSLSKDDYVQASVELSCVDEHLSKGDDVDLAKVESDILGNYGMDQKAYKKAQKKFSGDDALAKKVEKKLEDCNEKKAREYAGLEEGKEGAKKEGKAKEKEPAKPPVTGKFEGTISNQAGFDEAKLTVRVENDFDTRFSFKGKREGKGFNISGSGKIDKNGELDVTASSGKNNIQLVGKVASGSKEVNVKGKIWEKSFSVNVDVK